MQKKQSQLSKDVYIIFTYLVPDDTTYICRCNNDILGCLESLILKYTDKGMVILCGDLNARTGNKRETLEAIPGYEPNPDLFCTITEETDIPNRVSKDSICNARGRDILDLCKCSDMKMLNGRLDNDKGIGKFTRVGTTGNSVVDYVITRTEDIKYITVFKIEDLKPESDHKQVLFSIKGGPNVKSKTQTDNLHKNICVAFKWEKEKVDEMTTHLTDMEAWTYFEMYQMQMLENNSPNSVAEAFSNYILQAATKTLTRKKISKGKCSFPSNKWYDSECREMRAKLCKMKSISTSEWDDETKANHKRYRSITQKKKRAYKQDLLGELINSKKL